VGHGYDVTEAPDGRTALDLVGRTALPFDVVITDLAMPRMDGHELARRLGDLQPGLPVLFISGHPDEQAMRRVVESGLPMLQKPFTAEELIVRVDDLLRRVP
jgi:DNA-binding response OmpR family regulator